MTFDYAIGIDGRDEPKRVSPYVDYDPPAAHEPCEPCRRHYTAELDRWRNVAYALADAEAYHRDHRERLIADLATCQQANAALRRTIDRVHHYGEPE